MYGPWSCVAWLTGLVVRLGIQGRSKVLGLAVAMLHVPGWNRARACQSGAKVNSCGGRGWEAEALGEVGQGAQD